MSSKSFCLFLASLLLLIGCLSASKLKFRPDGTFRISHLTDLHFGFGEADLDTQTTMSRILDWENPDFVVLGGDVVSDDRIPPSERNRTRWVEHHWNQAVSPLVERNLQWATALGNHDLLTGLSTEQLISIDLSHPGCLSSPSNDGNYVIPIYDPEGINVASYIFIFNTRAKACLGYYSSGYACVTPSQVDWFKRTSQSLFELHGKHLPSLAFLHIPLMEMNDAAKKGTIYGKYKESVSSPKMNTGLYAAFLEMGNIKVATFGHDHSNDFVGVFPGGPKVPKGTIPSENAVILAYGRKTGHGSYNKFSLRGARIFQLEMTQINNVERNSEVEELASSSKNLRRNQETMVVYDGTEDSKQQKSDTLVIHTWLRLSDGEVVTYVGYEDRELLIIIVVSIAASATVISMVAVAFIYYRKKRAQLNDFEALANSSSEEQTDGLNAEQLDTFKVK